MAHFSCLKDRRRAGAALQPDGDLAADGAGEAGRAEQAGGHRGLGAADLILFLPDIASSVTAIITCAAFAYDAAGVLAKGVVNGLTTIYIADIYEYQAGGTTKYYDGGAMRRTGDASGNGVFCLLSDQLGSTSVIVSQAGMVQATNYYYPFGDDRGPGGFSGLTTRQFTGQYHASGLAGGSGLGYYGARWYDPINVDTAQYLNCGAKSGITRHTDSAANAYPDADCVADTNGG